MENYVVCLYGKEGVMGRDGFLEDVFDKSTVTVLSLKSNELDEVSELLKGILTMNLKKCVFDDYVSLTNFKKFFYKKELKWENYTEDVKYPSQITGYMIVNENGDVIDKIEPSSSSLREMYTIVFDEYGLIDWNLTDLDNGLNKNRLIKDINKIIEDQYISYDIETLELMSNISLLKLYESIIDITYHNIEDDKRASLEFWDMYYGGED